MCVLFVLHATVALSSTVMDAVSCNIDKTAEEHQQHSTSLVNGKRRQLFSSQFKWQEDNQWDTMHFSLLLSGASTIRLIVECCVISNISDTRRNALSHLRLYWFEAQLLLGKLFLLASGTLCQVSQDDGVVSFNVQCWLLTPPLTGRRSKEGRKKWEREWA